MNGSAIEYSETRILERKAEEIDTLLTASEAAKLLNIHIHTIRRWSNLGILPSFRIGPRKDRRFQKRDLITFLYH